MKLNPDCIRDILLSVEDVTDSEVSFEYDRYEDVPERLKRYSHNEVVYHINQCDFAGLIVGLLSTDCNSYVRIRDLSPAGHEFLANIRQDSIWNKSKEISAKIGSGSLSTLMQIAINVVSDLVKGHFGIG